MNTIANIKKMSTKQIRSMFTRITGRTAPEYYSRELLIAATVAHIQDLGISELWFTEKFMDMFTGKAFKNKNRGEVPEQIVRIVRQMKAEGATYKQIEAETGVKPNAAFYMIKRQTYQWVD